MFAFRVFAATFGRACFLPLKRCVAVAALVCALPATLLPAVSLMENLGRGVVAVRSTTTQAFVSWRLLGTEYGQDVAFNLYRSADGGAATKLNTVPITGATNYVDSTTVFTVSNAYTVRAVVDGIEQAAGAAFVLPANVAVQQYLRVPLQIPAGGTTESGENYTYSANDTSVGDLDGDGEYEFIVKWDPSNSKDNSQEGLTGPVIVDGYKVDGTRLWRINLGKNIRAGAHYTDVMVYDFDGDGKAEVAMKTADGTVDGLGVVIGNASADWRDLTPNPVSNLTGFILNGPEFLTMFNGQTGAAMATVPYVPPRGVVSSWGDSYGNRVDRFLAGVAYLDGKRPSLIMARGYYTRAVIAAWDWRDGALTQRWVFDSDDGTPGNLAYRGQGAHSLTVGDVDDDGKDEIVYGAAAIDDDGKGLYSSGLGHGDALHLSKMDPSRPGLQTFMPHEDPGSYGSNAMSLIDASTGEIISGVQSTGDVGRGVAADVDPRFPGYEFWGPPAGLYNATVAPVANPVLGPRAVQVSSSKPGAQNFLVWWDGDLLRELLDGTTVSKWNWTTSTTSTLLSASGVASNNSTKATPNLSADVIGDWREEIILRETNNSALRVYTTTNVTTHRLYTLMHDRQYRTAIAWQNTGYNQPPHPGFFLGDGMAAAPVPAIVTSLSELLGPAAPVFTGITPDTGALATDAVTSAATLTLHGTAEALAQIAVSRVGVGVIGTTVADASGNWSFDYTATTLSAGEHRFTARATDAQARTGSATNPAFLVRVDTAAPVAPTITYVAAGSGLTVRGSAEAGALVAVELAGQGVLGTTVAQADGQWELAVASLPAAAAWSFTAVAQDAAGNTGAASDALGLDGTLPPPTITGIADDSGVSATDGITQDNALVISGTGQAGATVMVTRVGAGPAGSVTVAGNGTWSLDLSGSSLADGPHVFLAATVPASGPVGAASLPFAVTIDTAAPTVASIERWNPASASTAGEEVTFRVTFSEAVSGIDASRFTLTFTGALAGNLSAVQPVDARTFDVTVNALTGEGTVRLNVPASALLLDTAGNTLATAYTTGPVYTRAITGDGTWINSAASGVWSTRGNWADGIIGAGVDKSASFTSIDLSGEHTVVLDSARTMTNLLFSDADAATPGDWVVSNNGTLGNAVMLQGSAGSPAIYVEGLAQSSVVRFNARIAGTQGFTKSGTGTLVLAQANTYTGTTSVTAGLLRVVAGGSASSATVNISASSQLAINGGTFTSSGTTTVNGGGGSRVVIDSGTATFGTLASNNSDGVVILNSGGTLNVTTLSFPRTTGPTPNYTTGFISTGGTSTLGTVNLGTNNSYGEMSVEGGTVNVTGLLTLGNLGSSSARGGAMRVTGGIFNSTNTASGIILSRAVNNVSYATFSGGVSMIEKFTFGFSTALTSGTGNLKINGGTVYLGSGGMVKGGAAGFITNIELSSGLLGAKAAWSTNQPITLPASGNITLKSASAANAAFDITLSGVISGAGGFTKTGAGALILSGANTFTGDVAVNEGTLNATGTFASGGTLDVNVGGTLAGTGTVNKAIALNSSGILAPAGTATAGTLNAASLTWNGGGKFAANLGATSDRLALTGALTKGTAGVYEFEFSGSPTVGSVHTVATFASTTFAASDFTFSGLSASVSGRFAISGGALTFTVTDPADAVFNTWANVLPVGQRTPTADPDGDGIANLLEFALGSDGALATARREANGILNVAGQNYPTLTYTRRIERGGVDVAVLVSASLDFSASLGSIEVSVTSAGSGLETVVVRSAVSLATQPRQFFRLTASLP